MSKFNLFTLFVTVIVVVIVGEVLVNDYAEEQGEGAKKSMGANVLEAETVTQETSEEEMNEDAPAITFGLIEQAGFPNATLQRVPFNGILFERIDLRDFKSVPVLQQNLLQGNRVRTASFYEFHAENDILAHEIYLLIRDKIGAGSNVGINETNDFGQESYYINYTELSKTAFLVVKKEESVYALTYRKELHAFITMLLTLL